MIREPAKSLTSTEPERTDARAPADPRDDVRSTFRRARFVLVALATCAALPTPLGPFLGADPAESSMGPSIVVGAWVSSALLLDRSAFRSETSLRTSLLLDVLGLTAVLFFVGAAQNPLTMLYFVPMALSTLLAQRSTWTVLGASVAGFCLLLFATARALGPHAHHGHFFHHVVGMAGALAVAGALVTYFAHRIARALERERSLVERLRREREQDRIATSLGALAAGAAHELGTPLGTIQLVADDLDALAPADLERARAVIAVEIGRMKEILHGMTSSELSAHVLSERAPWELGELYEELALGDDVDVRPSAADAVRTAQPKPILVQIVREFVKNGRSAHRGRGRLRLGLEARDGWFEVSVEDEGPGMTDAELERAFDPFVSGSGGRGLGLFLARVHARQLGGRVEIASRPGRGTRVCVKLPLESIIASESAEGGG